MQIAELQLAPDVAVLGDPRTEVTGASMDSRRTAPGDLYAALPGANVHGADFAPELIARGTAAILTDPAGLDRIRAALGTSAESAAFLVTEHPRAHLGAIAAQIYGTDPADPMLLGVTGTNGKTTTTYMIDGLLTALGRRTGLIGTVSTLIAGAREPSVRTTPESPELHALLARMRAARVDVCAMEVSSHAIAQHRIAGARFTVAGFTGLSQDHLDFHGTMEEYYEAKAALFSPLHADSGVVVLADDWSRRLAAASQIPVLTIARAESGDDADLSVQESGDGHFVLTDAHGLRIAARSPLPGDFNVMNTALALAMLLQSGIPRDELARAALDFAAPVPGRMEVLQEADPRAIVDYSHTPDAIAQVLRGLDPGRGPLVVVFGAGGDRDRGKRRAMGRAAAQGADAVIITDDNPRSEDPAEIRAEILAGAQEALADGSARVHAEALHVIASRSAAIQTGVRLAADGGTVVIAGKGHETGQEVAGVTHDFDDRAQTHAALRSSGGDAGAGKVLN